MRKFLVVCTAILCLSLTAAANDSPGSPEPSPQNGPAGFFSAERGRFELGAGYQYQDYHVLGVKFHNQAYDGSFNVHVFDPLTSYSWILTGSIEGAAIAGFEGQTGGKPNLAVKSVFLGAGPRIAIESHSRLEPWVHLLAGWERLRFTQTDSLGANSAFGFMAGGGLDFKLNPFVYWRVQADYFGTHFQPAPAINSNVAVGTGLVITF